MEMPYTLSLSWPNSRIRFSLLPLSTWMMWFAPAGVEKVMLRSDTAGYQRELLRYCVEGRDDRFGVIKFAVGVDVTAEFRRAVSEVAE